MKRIVLLAILTISISACFGQDSADVKTYRNELGVDIASLIKQSVEFFHFDLPALENNGHEPVYFLSYRRHLKAGNIRFAAGGNFINLNQLSTSQQDLLRLNNKYYSVDLRAGWEFCTPLGKRWQVFYGADFRPSYEYSTSGQGFWNAGYAAGKEFKVLTYGIAPLLGFRLRLNERVSMTTETNFSVNFSQISGKTYYIPESAAYPAVPDVKLPTTRKTYSSFSQPVCLILTFCI